MLAPAYARLYPTAAQTDGQSRAMRISWWWAAAAANMRCAGRSPPPRCAPSSSARRAMPASPKWPMHRRRGRGHRRPGGASPATRRSTSWWSGRRRRWSPAWPTARGGRHQGLRPVRPRRRSSKAPRASPRSSARATTSRPPPTSASPTPTPRRPMSRRRARRSWSRPTGSPPARASSWPRRVERGVEAARRHAVRATGFGAAGAAVVIEEFLDGRGGQLLCARATASTRCRWSARRTTSAPSTATRAPTPAAWAPIRRRRCSTPAMQRRAMGEIILPTVRGHGRGRHALQGRALCRADDRPRGPEALRIQLPLRRSGVPGADAAPEVRHRAGADRLGRRRAEAFRPALVDRSRRSPW